MSYYENALKVKPILDLGKLAQKVGITAEEKPVDLPDRPGYKWEPILNDKVIGWYEVEDPDAQGTADNPIPWVSGMQVQVNYFYSYESTTKVCVQNGNPTDFADPDETYFVAL